ncbi:MAG TPA: fumarylacetoacetate hydrolase family protein, partial [Geothrix sp.]|nr:fumarylacetoacetate hydrolase family protein [Geothrix sp.]
MDTVIPAPVMPVIPVRGGGGGFPVRRIYCVGRNYADHAREMGGDPNREPPFFFGKPQDTVVPGGGEVAYP